LDFAQALGRFIPHLRILVTANRPQPEDVAALGDFLHVPAAEDSPAVRQVMFIGGGADFPVGPHDIFVTHGWFEAYRAQSWTAWQAETYRVARNPLLLLIQEFEPGFYSYSARYALADETFRSSAPHIAVFNTALLHEYFLKAGYQFQKTYIFEPRLHHELSRKLAESKGTSKERILFCYSRPTTHRNGFELAALALREWAKICPSANSWRIVSAGSPHAPFRISADITISSSGKLSLDEYADLLSRSAVGLSLMISPHPSYPPLEFAHFGLLVVTNRFANKDIGPWHDNIFALDTVRPESIAQKLAELCETTILNQDVGWQGATHIPHFVSQDSPFDFAEELSRELLEMQPEIS
jgi:hypothetical protein